MSPELTAPAPRTAPQFVAFALAGVVAAFLGLAAGQLLAAVWEPAAAPVAVVSATAIDLPPAPVKEWAVQTFGTASKTVVSAVVIAVVILLAAVAGLTARRRPMLGALIALIVGAIGVIAGIARPGEELTALLPSALAGLVAAGALLLQVRWLQRSEFVMDPTAAKLSRRTVLLGGAGMVGVGVLAWTGASLLVSRTAAVASRLASVLPRPTVAGPEITAAMQAPVPGMPTFVTANDVFYRIDTAVVVPQVEAGTWTLSVGGMVDRPFQMTYDELLAMPMVEADVTLTCISNEIGGPYIGNARWLGVPLWPLLEKAGVSPASDQLISTSVDGFTAGTPVAALRDGRVSLLAVGMNGEPLPIDHGFPVRMVVAGLYGFVSATKWLKSLEFTTYGQQQAYWTSRGWATDAPVLTGSKVQVPAPYSTIKPGRTAIGGTAWAQDRGISRVEVQVDNGPWQECNLAEVPNDDTWRQWWAEWEATPGWHTLRTRATDGQGITQTAAIAPPFPSGATGWHEIRVLVE